MRYLVVFYQTLAKFTDLLGWEGERGLVVICLTGAKSTDLLRWRGRED